MAIDSTIMGNPNTAGAAMRSTPTNLTPDGNPGDSDDQKGTATTQSAYVAPTSGQPTICQNCMHFDGSGSCDHPQVIADPQVSGKVEANGHSKFFYAKGAEASENEGPQYDEGAAALAGGARFPSAGRM